MGPLRRSFLIRARLYLGVAALGVLACLKTSEGYAGRAAQSSSPDSAGAHAALDGFLRAFENLDWERFRASFADEATVFFPSAATPGRFEGRRAIEARFRQEFATIRSQTRGGPPYMQLKPIGLHLEMLDERTALVTFELHSAVRFARRSLLLVRQPAGWRIQHLHASNVPWPDQEFGSSQTPPRN